jgi:ATP-dependent Clp protease adapter protein ClpS
MASHKRLQHFTAWLSALFRPATGLILPPGTSLIHVEGMIPLGFRCGLEILNDDKTPMLFVVSVLRSRVSLSNEDAHRTMLTIHERGGILLPIPSLEESRRIADAVTEDATKKHHPLVCRAVSVAE